MPRSLEVLDQRGVVDRFLDAGSTVPAHGFAGIPLDLSDLPTRHNYVLSLPQRELEPILAGPFRARPIDSRQGRWEDPPVGSSPAMASEGWASTAVIPRCMPLARLCWSASSAPFRLPERASHV